MSESPIDLEELIQWLRSLTPNVRFGSIGIMIRKSDGVITGGERIYRETYKCDPPVISKSDFSLDNE